jgi:hypothetical protein
MEKLYDLAQQFRHKYAADNNDKRWNMAGQKAINELLKVVKQYQKRLPADAKSFASLPYLSVDGVVGPKTKAALDGICNLAGPLKDLNIIYSPARICQAISREKSQNYQNGLAFGVGIIGTCAEEIEDAVSNLREVAQCQCTCPTCRKSGRHEAYKDPEGYPDQTWHCSNPYCQKN